MDFNACDLDYLERTFGLQLTINPAELSDWLDNALALNEGERYEANALRDMLQLNVLHWNEQE